MFSHIGFICVFIFLFVDHTVLMPALLLSNCFDNLSLMYLAYFLIFFFQRRLETAKHQWSHARQAVPHTEINSWVPSECPMNLHLTLPAPGGKLFFFYYGLNVNVSWSSCVWTFPSQMVAVWKSCRIFRMWSLSVRSGSLCVEGVLRFKNSAPTSCYSPSVSWVWLQCDQTAFCSYHHAFPAYCVSSLQWWTVSLWSCKPK